MATDYTRWYRDGTVALTKNSAEVTGVSTYWGTANLNPGDVFVIGQNLYEIASITDNTHLTLKTAYTGDTASGQGYAIIRNFTASTQAKTAAQTAELLGDFARYIDAEHKTITGKSAYEVAKDSGYVGTQEQWLESLTAYGQAKLNGYTGTLAQWLESLKAAGEWTNASTRLAALEGINAESRLKEIESYYSFTATPVVGSVTEWNHNHYPQRAVSLGNEVTAEHLKWIDSNALHNYMYMGSYWQFNNIHLEFPTLNEDQTGDTYHDDYPITFDGIMRVFLLWAGPYDWSKFLVSLLCGGFKKNGSSLGNTFTFPMNYKDSNECGYAYSIVHTKILPVIQAKLEEIFGETRLRNITKRVSTGYNTVANVTAKLFLPSIEEVLGYDLWSKQLYLNNSVQVDILFKNRYEHESNYKWTLHESMPTCNIPSEQWPNYQSSFLAIGEAAQPFDNAFIRAVPATQTNIPGGNLYRTNFNAIFRMGRKL